MTVPSLEKGRFGVSEAPKRSELKLKNFDPEILSRYLLLNVSMLVLKCHMLESSRTTQERPWGSSMPSVFEVQHRVHHV